MIAFVGFCGTGVVDLTSTPPRQDAGASHSYLYDDALSISAVARSPSGGFFVLGASYSIPKRIGFGFLGPGPTVRWTEFGRNDDRFLKDEPGFLRAMPDGIMLFSSFSPEPPVGRRSVVVHSVDPSGRMRRFAEVVPEMDGVVSASLSSSIVEGGSLICFGEYATAERRFGWVVAIDPLGRVRQTSQPFESEERPSTNLIQSRRIPGGYAELSTDDVGTTLATFDGDLNPVRHVLLPGRGVLVAPGTPDDDVVVLTKPPGSRGGGIMRFDAALDPKGEVSLVTDAAGLLVTAALARDGALSFVGSASGIFGGPRYVGGVIDPKTGIVSSSKLPVDVGEGPLTIPCSVDESSGDLVCVRTEFGSLSTPVYSTTIVVNEVKHAVE